jgi:hypothetical protein
MDRAVRMVEGIESKKDPGIIIYSNLLHGNKRYNITYFRADSEEGEQSSGSVVLKTEIAKLPFGLYFPEHPVAGTPTTQPLTNRQTDTQGNSHQKLGPS